MTVKFIVYTVYILGICVFSDLGLESKDYEDESEKCLKNTNTNLKDIDKGNENLRKEEEKPRDNPTAPENQYGEPFPTSNTSHQNLEDKKMFFVITTIFNPSSYESRYNLYRNFARYMEDTGAQLMTIECIFPSLNQTEFQVTESDNPMHIQLRSESVYWMKENLINIAVSRLPPNAKWICWLDADIEFDKNNWVELTIKELNKYTIIQMFEKVHFLGPAPENEILKSYYSFGYTMLHNKNREKNIDLKKYSKAYYPHPGNGWAMTVADFRAINGLPDYIITGSGDHLFAYSLLNQHSVRLEYYSIEGVPEYVQMMVEKMDLTFPKLKDFAEAENKEIMGYLPITVRHYWHGANKHRQYIERWNILTDQKFDFHNDVTIADNGLFQLNPNKPDLQQRFIEYFQNRQEDSD